MPRTPQAPALLAGLVIVLTAGLAGCGSAAGGKAASTPAATHPASAAAVTGGDPQAAGAPHVAAMPTHSAGRVTKPSPAPASASGAATSPPATPAASAGGGSAQTPSSAAGAGSAVCTHPQYVTSDPNGMWNADPYFVANDAWNVSGYHVSQTIYACSYSNWYVTATMDNSKGDGAVKTYPNSHRDFANLPQISSFKSITSTFAITDPGRGSYEDAYDIWLNGIGGDGATEVMIWTSNHGQTPSGTAQGTVTVGGRSYTAWKTSGSYIAFVAAANYTSGSVDLLAFFRWLMSKGWISSGATLGQVDYGVELVSTNGAPETFAVSDFSVNAS